MYTRGRWDPDWRQAQRRLTLERLAKNRYPQRMDTNQQHEKVRREKILSFWKDHGTRATSDAFGVCERTLFRWQKNSTPQSRVHRRGYAKRSIHPALALEIIRLRTLYPRLGKEKLTPLLTQYCKEHSIPLPSEPTVGRMLAQLKDEGKLPSGATLRMQANRDTLVEKKPLPKKKKLSRGSFLPKRPGDLLQLDGVLIFTLGQRRYTFTAVDLMSRWAFSKTYKTASSRNAAEFLHELRRKAPFEVKRIQTDNGSEFMKEFSEAMGSLFITHFHNWVKQPKYQGWIERFNRTIQEEFLDWHKAGLAGDPELFNQELAGWLAFYNGSRVHRGLGRSGQRLTPLQYLATTKD